MRRFIAACLCVLLLAPLSAAAPQTAGARAGAPASQTLSAETRQRLTQSMSRAAAFVRAQQQANGSYGHPGVDAIAATALLRQPGVPRAEALRDTEKTLDLLKGLAKPDGGIYVKDIPHYITAVAVMALVAGARPADRPVIDRGRQYLAQNLLDEGEGIAKDNKFYGGIGYGGNTGVTADIISLEFGLRAIHEAGVPVDDPAWQKAIAFLQRTQNRGESNDQAFSADDGGFMYYPGNSQVSGTTRSYGSASYAGIMSYTWANVKKTDPRVQSVLSWVRDNYTVDENPGIGNKALYYYYMVFAKALQAVGEDVIVDARGQRHNWREDLARKIIALQAADGSWVNENPAEMQNNKVLVTSFTMMAMQAILQ
jgi:squalene-hopene/tetraprenyl-beta-curcumene cyclase